MGGCARFSDFAAWAVTFMLVTAVAGQAGAGEVWVTNMVSVLRDWSGVEVPVLPEALGVNAYTVRAFQKRTSVTPLRCLVRTVDGAEWCWSPGFGLLRHADPAWITTELVHAE